MWHSWDDFLESHPQLASALSSARSCLPPANFITIHYAYFIVVPLVCSVIFWGSSDPSFSISYIDSLFLVVSAMTEAGLNTVNLSQMTTWQQIMLWLLIIFGSTIWVSIWTILARKHVFERRFAYVVQSESQTPRTRRNWTLSNPPSVQRLVPFAKSHSTPSRLGVPALGPAGGRLSATSAGERHLAHGHAMSSLSMPSALEGIRRDTNTSGGQFDQDKRTKPWRTTSSGHSVSAHEPQCIDNGHSSTRPEPVPVTRRHVASTKEDHGLPTSQPRRINWALPPFLTNKTVGRNAQFHDLTSEEREQLSGCEYKALKFLAVVVPLYSFAWQLLGCLALGAWNAKNMPGPAIANGINPWWLGVFNGVSAFNNCGMSLLDANMIPYQNAYFMLITMGLLILAGNTAFPIFLRLIIWTGLKVLKLTTPESSFSDWKATLDFILKYPRRVYTNLFPARPTWWLAFMVAWLNCTDWVAFELLNLGNPVIDSIAPGSRVLDGLFQAVAVRSGGFYVVPISKINIGLQVLYVIMMYISVYPVVITMRHSNVYEERSLGIYANDASRTPDVEENSGLQPSFHPLSTGHASSRPGSQHRRTASANVSEVGRFVQRTLVPWFGVGIHPVRHGRNAGESRISFISQQVHGQLAHDIWWLVLSIFIISTIETSHFDRDPVTFSVFNIVFEVVSAYGCVGISVGLPFAAYSFAGGWHGASKLILCLVMLRGRHRGLPVALDRAVRLPCEQLSRDEEEDHYIRRSMTSRRAVDDDT